MKNTGNEWSGAAGVRVVGGVEWCGVGVWVGGWVQCVGGCVGKQDMS